MSQSERVITVVCGNSECGKEFQTIKHGLGAFKKYCSDSCEARAAHVRRRDRRNGAKIPPYPVQRSLEEIKSTGLTFEERQTIKVLVSNTKRGLTKRDTMGRRMGARSKDHIPAPDDNISRGWWGPALPSSVSSRMFPRKWDWW